MRETYTVPNTAVSDPRILIRLILLIAALLVLLFGPGALFAEEAEDAPAAYIVKGASCERVAELVVEVGGKVTHELRIIRSVGARLTGEQRDTLVAHPEVDRVWRDRQAKVQSAGTLTVLDRFDGSSG